MGPIALYHRFGAELRLSSIAAKEMYPIVWMLRNAGDILKGTTWHICTDNVSNVFALLKGSTKGDARPLLSQFWSICADLDYFNFIPAWLPREYNSLMDRASKAPDALSFINIIRKSLKCNNSSTNESALQTY
jgi:hypothetical protein